MNEGLFQDESLFYDFLVFAFNFPSCIRHLYILLYLPQGRCPKKNCQSLDEKFIETFEKKTLIFQISILDMKSAKMVFCGQMRGNGHC